MAKGPSDISGRRPSTGGGASGTRSSSSSSSGVSSKAVSSQNYSARTYIEKDPRRVAQGRRLASSQAKKARNNKRLIGATAGVIGAAAGYAVGKGSSSKNIYVRTTPKISKANRAKAMSAKLNGVK